MIAPERTGILESRNLKKRIKNIVALAVFDMQKKSVDLFFKEESDL